MIEVREFIIVDPALTTNPTSDFSVLGWCTMQNKVCTVEQMVPGRWETLDLAKVISDAACPNGSARYPSFTNHVIPTIYIEEIGTFETLRKSIVAFAPAIKWDIRPVGGHSENEKDAKVLRIAHAIKAFDEEERLKLGQLIDPRIKAELKAQLRADENGYKANGHDDLADLLGLIVQVIDFDPPPVKATYEGSGSGGSNLDFIHSLQRKKDDDNGGNDPDSGGGSGIACA